MYKKTIVVLGIIIVCIVVYLSLVWINKPFPNHPFFSENRPLVIAHRGGLGLMPEHTMIAYENAVTMGVDVIEMDIQSTKDGVFVLIHDEDVDRTTNESGKVSGFTLEELKDLDAGYYFTLDEGITYPYRGEGITVPTFEEILTAFPNTRMNIEIKQIDSATMEDFCLLLKKHEVEKNVWVASGYAGLVKEFRNFCPEVATAATWPETLQFMGLNTFSLGKAFFSSSEAFAPPEYYGKIRIITPRFVEIAHFHNMKVIVWTVDETEDMERLLSYGVDGIITNYPDKLITLLDQEY